MTWVTGRNLMRSITADAAPVAPTPFDRTGTSSRSLCQGGGESSRHAPRAEDDYLPYGCVVRFAPAPFPGGFDAAPACCRCQLSRAQADCELNADPSRGAGENNSRLFTCE